MKTVIIYVKEENGILIELKRSIIYTGANSAKLATRFFAYCKFWFTKSKKASKGFNCFSQINISLEEFSPNGKLNTKIKN